MTFGTDVKALEARVNEILQRLTLDEKLSLCAGKSLFQTKGVPRLGIKPMKLTDGPRGVAFHSSLRRCTAFPSGIAQAATWNPELLQRYGEALGEEAKAVGARVVLAPAINITRTPMNGRTFEYLSEDPHLNARLTVPVVRGIQSRGVAACAKHLAANNQETDRVRIDAKVSERALEEIYLPAFKAAVEEGEAWSVMAAYNALNGSPCCESEFLLRRKLREEWGFRGLVVSDWFAARRTSSPEACIKAGLNLEMPGKGSKLKTENLKASFERDAFTEAELDDSVRDLLRVMVLTGHVDDDRRPASRNTPAHQQLALEMAGESLTLLKNDNDLLPLNPAKVRTLAVIGPKARRRNCFPLWGGSAGVWPPYEVTPLAGIKAENRGRFKLVKSPRDADAVVLFVGLSHKPGLDSEGFDRSDFGLGAKQDQLIADTVAQNPNTVVVLVSGSPVAMPWLDQVPALLAAWYPGMEGGRAIARALFGVINPSGKLPVTFPEALADSPAHQSTRTFPGEKTPGENSVVHYDEGVFVGYRHFDHTGLEPLFPFGHGLSYTRFEYSDCELDRDSVGAWESLRVSFTLSNRGERDGAEVVQCYVSQEQGDGPPQALKGFRKLALKAGESRPVVFEIPAQDLRQFRDGEWRLNPGRYSVRLGSSSRDIRLERGFSVIE